MNGAKDPQGLFSRLPDDPDYWSGLSERIVDETLPGLTEISGGRSEWWFEIARFSTLLAAGAAAAVFAAFFLTPSPQAPESPVRTVDSYGLAPDDPLAATLVSGATPPTIGTIMALRTAEPE